LEIIRQCIFPFFNLKSYLMMSFMVLLGILIQINGRFPTEWIRLFFLYKLAPLLLSTIRSFNAWSKYPEFLKEKIHLEIKLLESDVRRPVFLLFLLSD